MKKQYINSSNMSPSAMLSTPWLLVVTVKVFDLPSWVYGVAGTLAVILLVTFLARIFTEEGVDLVKR